MTTILIWLPWIGWVVIVVNFLKGFIAWLWRPRGVPAQSMAPPYVAMDCGYTESLNQEEATYDGVFDGTETGGRATGHTLHVPPGVRVRLKESLVMVAGGDIRIDGDIIVPVQMSPLDKPVNVTIISIDGSVTITGTVGRGCSGPGAASTVTQPYAKASSSPGRHGGFIKVVGQSITVSGRIEGTMGGSGGTATATGQVVGFVFGGSADAVAAQAGRGGDVILCAKDSITVPGTILGSWGGFGGNAIANSVNGSDAYALGGPGNGAGDVVFTGMKSSTPCLVNISGTVNARDGGTAGMVFATVVSAGIVGPGGTATARGTVGGAAGSVRFVNCTVAGAGVIAAGNGGYGGSAYATGGPGRNAFFVAVSTPGGDAYAYGGQGGSPAGSVVGGPGAPGKPGSGGSTNATAGNGGNGSVPASGSSSGVSYTEGGPNGAGVLPVPPSLTAGPVPATPGWGGAGGVGPLVMGAGAP